MKKILTLALAAVMVLSLAACGGSSAPAATTAAPAAPAGETAAPAPEAPAAAEVKIAVVCDASGQNDNGYNQSAVEGAKELADLAIQLENAGSHTAYEQVMAAVSDFEKGNMRLSVVLASLEQK